MIRYDGQLIYSFAEGLYEQAGQTIVAHGALYGLIGLAVGVYWQGFIGAVVGGALGVGIGASIGKGKAAVLKLQAQMALCQVQIEENTRAAAQAGGR